jgi:organic radical activating enzyme
MKGQNRSGHRAWLFSEIFNAIQGAGTGAGRTAIFVRKTDCHLRCAWCDTV